MNFTRRSLFLPLAALTALGGLLIPARPAQAQVPSGLISIGNVVLAAPGGTGSFDVLLTAPDPSSGVSGSLSVGSFTVEPTVSGAGITFTAAGFDTATPYIFPDSFDQDNGFTLSDEIDDPFPSTDLIASDSDAAAGSAVIVPDLGTVGLAHITYRFDGADTPGTVYTISFNSDGTSLSDGTGTVSYSVTPLPGVLTVSPIAAPEPSGLVCLLLAGVLLVCLRGGAFVRGRLTRG